MTVVVASSGFSIPFCKPTKDQLAWITTRLRWVLGAFYLTGFSLYPGSPKRFNVSLAAAANLAVCL
jgi:hypothetical protein